MDFATFGKLLLEFIKVFFVFELFITTIAFFRLFDLRLHWYFELLLSCISPENHLNSCSPYDIRLFFDYLSLRLDGIRVSSYTWILNRDWLHKLTFFQRFVILLNHGSDILFSFLLLKLLLKLLVFHHLILNSLFLFFLLFFLLINLLNLILSIFIFFYLLVNFNLLLIFILINLR